MVLIFSKPLSNADVSGDLALPTRDVHHLPVISDGQQAVKFVATDVSTGTPWNFTYFRQNGNNPRPVLRSRGWKSFVRNKNLKVGDKISFYKFVDEATSETSFWVDAEEKKVMPFGVNIANSVDAEKKKVMLFGVNIANSVDAEKKKVMLFGVNIANSAGGN